jgi:hypothetical protein
MVRDVIASGDEDLYRYVIAWCADAVQNPTKSPGVVLVLKGKQGTGKGTFGREVGRLFGNNHFVHATGARQLVGKFNAHLANVLLVFADEAFFAGDKQSEGILKAMITEPRIPLEYKGKDIIYLQNYLRIIMASNQLWVVPAAIDDRRFAVIEVSERHLRDIPYFAAINEQMENGGREALLHYLQNFDLTGIELRDLPKTQARLEQQLRSMSSVEKWWFGRLSSGAVLPSSERWAYDPVVCSQVLEDYVKHAGISGERFRADATALGMELKRLVPGIRRRRCQVEKKQVWCYEFPPLAECRRAFMQLFEFAVTWPDDGGSAADIGYSFDIDA